MRVDALRVDALHRYPVKSMLGESSDAVGVHGRGLVGDRGMALVDQDTGLVASAKQPRKWGRLLSARATFGHDGVVSIDLPDGRTLRGDDDAIHDVLSAFTDRRVVLSATPPAAARLERFWPEVDGLAPADVIATTGRTTPMAAGAHGTFFDYAPIHIVTTSSLRELRRRHPSSDFAAERFRPNIILSCNQDGFVENEWAGRGLAMGDDVVLDVVAVTPRCAVPSLSHGALAADLDVLRGVVASNRIPRDNGRFACVGVYAQVVAGGVLRSGDPVRFC